MSIQIVNLLAAIKLGRNYSLQAAQSSGAIKKQSQEVCEVTKLKNGLKVACKPVPNARTSVVGLFADVGSRHEEPNQSGLCNLFNQIALLNKELSTQAFKRNAHFFVRNTRETSSLILQVMRGDEAWAVETLARLIRDPSVDSTTLRQAKSNALANIEARNKQPRHLVLDYLHATAFQGTPFEAPARGRAESLLSIQKQDIVDFVNLHMRGPRLAVCAVGGVDSLSSTAGWCEKHLGSIDANLGVESVRRKIRFTGSDLRDRDDANPLAHVAIGFQGPGWTSNDCVALMVAGALNGRFDRCSSQGGANSAGKIAQAVFQEGRIHQYEHFLLRYHDTSLFGVYFAAERLDLEISCEFVQYEMMRVCLQATDFEVQRAKNELKTHLAVSLLKDGQLRTCGQMGRDLLVYDRVLSVGELMERINMVSANEIRTVLNKYFYDHCPAVASFGPIEALLGYDRIRKNVYWLRT